MTKLYQTLKPLLKTRPHFDLKYIMLKCPAFIANAILAKHVAKPGISETFYSKKAAVSADSPEINTNQVQHKYQ